MDLNRAFHLTMLHTQIHLAFRLCVHQCRTQAQACGLRTSMSHITHFLLMLLVTTLLVFE